MARVALEETEHFFDDARELFMRLPYEEIVRDTYRVVRIFNEILTELGMNDVKLIAIRHSDDHRVFEPVFERRYA